MTDKELHDGLGDDEFVELGELLAALPETCSPMEPDRLDGYLTAIALMPEDVPPSAWMPYVFDENADPAAVLDDEDDEARLEELIYRRFCQIEDQLRRCRPIDPIIYDVEDESGRPLGGWEAIAALAPFASGFHEACGRWPSLTNAEDELVRSALLGIWRHLPEEELGDLSDIKNDLELESPLETLKEAIEDVAVSCAEIASVTRGFRPQEERRPAAGAHRRPGAHRGAKHR